MVVVVVVGGGVSRQPPPPPLSSQDEAKKTLSCQFVRPSVPLGQGRRFRGGRSPRRSLRALAAAAACPAALAPPAALAGLGEVSEAGAVAPSPFFPQLVHPLSAVPGSTVAGDLVLIVLEVELVVVGELRGEQGVNHGTSPSLALPPPASPSPSAATLRPPA